MLFRVLLAVAELVRSLNSGSLWSPFSHECLWRLICRYSLSLDEAVENTLCMMTSEEERAALNDILRVTSSAVKYQMVTDDSTTLYLGLHHTRSSLRTLAVEQLASNLRQNLVSVRASCDGWMICQILSDPLASFNCFFCWQRGLFFAEVARRIRRRNFDCPAARRQSQCGGSCAQNEGGLFNCAWFPGFVKHLTLCVKCL